MTRKSFGIALGLATFIAWAAGCGSSEGSNFVDPNLADAGPDGNPPIGPIGGGDGAPPVDEPDGSPPIQGSCTHGADGGSGCQFDTYCDPATNTCVPFGPGQNNAECHQVAVPGNFAPKTKCEFPTSIPIAGDAFPDHVDVQTTPMVVRFGKDAVPSIVVPFTKPVAKDDGEYTEHLGVLRILKGSDCTQEAVLGGKDFDDDGDVDWFRSSASPAIGDLDGDGLPDIVAFISSGTTKAKQAETLMAFSKKSGSWEPLWATKKATTDGATIFKATVPGVTTTEGKNFGKGNWASPSIHDLDDDGVPEIIREGWVFDGRTGLLRASPPSNYNTYNTGIHPVLANLDDDPKIEMTNGAHIWEFDGATGSWKEETYYDQTTTSNAGWVAVADFDPMPGTAQIPEIAVVRSGNLTIYTTSHAVFKGMNISVPGGGGGPPTIADFDGDGLPEIAIAGQAYYTVFDPDCQGTPRAGGKCEDRIHCNHVASGNCPDLILWSRATQDNSSNITGSSVFDFEADGKAEVVYADECFTRVYSGSEGTVLFSRYRSSCTWNENPVVADVDGDFRAELVVGSNTACGEIGVGQPCLHTNETDDNGGTGQLEPDTDIDSQFIGLRCLKGTDCVSGNCDNGFCRCATSAECCADKDTAACESFGTKCAAPPAGTPGTGKTCRANHPKAIQGIRVYEDANDQWVRSRSIWNQHAYAVTNVNEDGTIPKTSDWQKNWTQAGLNNFRQNVPGTANASDIGDLTAQSTATFSCNNTTAVLATPVCNRGTAPIGAGVSVGFYAGTTKACSAKTAGVLQPGACESVSCEWLSPPSKTPGVDIDVVPNDDGALAQCDPNNDKGRVKAVFCDGVH